MKRSYEESFEFWVKVSPEFEKFVENSVKNSKGIYSTQEFIPGSLRLYLHKNDISSWGHFAKEGDTSFHWHLAGLLKNSSIESSVYTGGSLFRNNAIVYSNTANYGHCKVPINPDSLIGEHFIEAEKFHVSELEKAILNFDKF